MRKNILTTAAGVLAALAFMAFTAPGFAQVNTGVRANTGAAGTHMSVQGRANTNGPNSSDRDKGNARAQDRTTHAKTQAKAHAKSKAKHGDAKDHDAK